MTDAQQNKILSRVRKMLALADCKGAAEGERDNALRMAYNLLAKHNLTLNEVEANAAQGEDREEQTATFVVYPWARDIAHSVAGMFFCNYYFMRNWNGKQARHVFIGRQSNAVTASYMADYVVRSVLREATKRYGSAIAPQSRAFAVGVAHKLWDRIEQIKSQQSSAPADQEAQRAKAYDAAKAAGDADGMALYAPMAAGSALVLATLHDSEEKANSLWLEAQGTTLKETKAKTKDVTNAGAYNAGKTFGASVSLAPQVGGKANSNVKAIK